MIGWQITFWISVFLIMHSYLLYPWLLQILSARKKDNQLLYSREELPPVTIIMSVFNEDAILERKIDSILKSNYPEGKLSILVGSDASTDNSNKILLDYQKKLTGFHARIFEQRQGKAAVINQLVKECQDALIVMTDAKVIFHQDTVIQLIRQFRNPELGIVGANVINETVDKDGVSIQEKAFMSREILMKYREGLIWGATIGVYGAIYAIRKDVYRDVPKGFAVDDFYITMEVLRQKKHAILDYNAISYLEVPNLLSEEYRRKVRIATGNYRNLRYFARELFTPWKGVSFAYISHKVIRWLGPFLLLLFLLSGIFLYNVHEFYQYAVFLSAAVALMPIIDFFLSKIGIHIVFLRFVRHFISMNIALLHGFFNNIGGISKDVWKPTNR